MSSLKPRSSPYTTERATLISSSPVIPVLSPNPFTVACTQLAPASSPANALAAAKPRSLWQCTSIPTLFPKWRCMNLTKPCIPLGVNMPTVSAIETLSAPASYAIRHACIKKCGSDRVASSGVKRTFNP